MQNVRIGKAVPTRRITDPHNDNLHCLLPNVKDRCLKGIPLSRGRHGGSERPATSRGSCDVRPDRPADSRASRHWSAGYGRRSTAAHMFGNRVGLTPSGVQIPYPPPRDSLTSQGNRPTRAALLDSVRERPSHVQSQFQSQLVPRTTEMEQGHTRHIGPPLPQKSPSGSCRDNRTGATPGIDVRSPH